MCLCICACKVAYMCVYRCTYIATVGIICACIYVLVRRLICACKSGLEAHIRRGRVPDRSTYIWEARRMKAYKKPASPLAASEQGGSFGFGRARRADPPGAPRARKGCGSDRSAAFAGCGCNVFEAHAGGDGRGFRRVGTARRLRAARRGALADDVHASRG